MVDEITIRMIEASILKILKSDSIPNSIIVNTTMFEYLCNGLKPDDNYTLPYISYNNGDEVYKYHSRTELMLTIIHNKETKLKQYREIQIV